eukprot:CAMPEP_0202865634 /NCGR_PEP_ID=MMETSP1391-20130828/6268_1 /ASSEMBLY_ACC=CAM_ASM_000867 /TAXON_ID=1034604 /ORGANISM="Chlamydomonas leiostraca, Strain SAG 11-49" /LENGTH=184 /DNA_ID=CAMNT_0049545497 /DNA_START=1475 /DNA_END=2031 /DNA_ORIENTATION=-
MGYWAAAAQRRAQPLMLQMAAEASPHSLHKPVSVAARLEALSHLDPQPLPPPPQAHGLAGGNAPARDRARQAVARGRARSAADDAPLQRVAVHVRHVGEGVAWRPGEVVHGLARHEVKRGAPDRLLLGAAGADGGEEVVRLVQGQAAEPVQVRDDHGGRAAQAGGAVHVYFATCADLLVQRAHS